MSLLVSRQEVAKSKEKAELRSLRCWCLLILEGRLEKKVDCYMN